MNPDEPAAIRTPGAPGDQGRGDAPRGPQPGQPQPPTRQEEQRPQGLLAAVRETALLVVLAVGLAVLLKTFVVQAFYIPSGSMEPTLLVSDRVLVEKLSYRFGEIQHGDVVVFVHDDLLVEPRERGILERLLEGVGQAIGIAPPSERDFIKRVVGLPGDRISCRDGRLYRNNQPVSEPYLPPGTATVCEPSTVAPGKLFVMGDNRTNSQDSRVIGQIDQEDVVGRAFVRIWPPGRIGWLRRD